MALLWSSSLLIFIIFYRSKPESQEDYRFPQALPVVFAFRPVHPSQAGELLVSVSSRLIARGFHLSWNKNQAGRNIGLEEKRKILFSLITRCFFDSLGATLQQSSNIFYQKFVKFVSSCGCGEEKALQGRVRV